MKNITRIRLLIAASACICGSVVSSYAQKSVTARKAAALPANPAVAPIMVNVSDPAGATMHFTYSMPDAGIKNTALQYEGTDLSEVAIGNALQRGNEGEPVLPVIPVQIVLPAGSSMDAITVTASRKSSLNGTYRIKHGEAKTPLIPGAKPHAAKPKASIYDSNDPYPANVVELVGIQKKRGISVAIVKVYPVQYRPRSGKITVYESLSFTVQTKKNTAKDHLKARLNKLNAASLQIENPEALDTYSGEDENGAAAPSDSGSVVPLGICNPEESFSYVVVTADSFRTATTDYTVNDLVAHKQSRGLSATIVTIEEVLANYPGIDNAERLRNFIIDAYTNWETDFVLLGGDINIIPMRKLYCYGGGYTDQIPSDLYYQCLDGTYNSDNDTYWGETTDGPGGTDIDLMAEVYIGRASAENSVEMSNFVYKTLAYENESESAPYLRNALMVGEYLGFGGVAEYATATMEEIRLGTSEHGYTTEGFAASPLFSVDTLYDRAGYDWPASEILSRMSSGAYGIYNHLGHANDTYVMKFYNPSADALTNNDFFFAYSQGCIPGNFEVDCMAEHLTTSTRHGAYAVVFNARYGWGAFNSTDGPSQRFNRQFWDAYFGEFMTNLGALNADSHEDNIWDINGDCIRWCYYETNLLGDPQTPVRGRVTGPSLAYSSHTVDDATGGNGDGLINPGETVSLLLTATNVGTETATGVTATVTTTDPYATVVSGTCTFGTLQCCGATGVAGAPIQLGVLSNCPTPRTIPLTCLLRDVNDSTWTSSFTVTVYTSSQISGHVRTLTGGAPVTGAVVSFTGPVSGSVTTDASGAYMFGGIDGTYAITASADGFLVPDPVSVTIPPAVSGIDFNLSRPLIALSPPSMRVDMLAGGSETRTLTISNSGDAPLSFTAAPQDLLGAPVPSAESLYDASHFVKLEKGAVDTRIGNPVRLNSGGPDAFGYRWDDSDEPGGPAYSWTDISGTGTLLTTVSGCLDCYESVSLSFPFEFYGTSYSSLYVNSNGYITFGAGSYQYTNYGLPSTSMPANLIAGFFDDLYPGNGGSIYFQDFGDRAVVQFTEVTQYATTASLTYQMVLYPNGTIIFYYNTMTGTLTSATVGIQNSTQDDGLAVVYNASYIKNGLAVRLRAAPPWLSITPESGTVASGASIECDVDFTSEGIAAGLTTGFIGLEHNDPTSASPLQVPCTLYIDGIRRLSVTPTNIDFGSCWVGLRDTATLTLANSGDEATVVSSVTSSNGYFSTVSSLPLTVPPFSSATLLVEYAPVTLGSHTATMTVISNAEDNPALPVYCTGSGTNPPSIAVTPSQLTSSLNAGDSSSHLLQIANSGGAPLSFSIEVEVSVSNPIGSNDILIIGDGGTETGLELLFSDAGYNVTIVSDDAIYTGDNPSPEGFAAVILTDGTNYGSNMPSLGQSALVSYVQNGGGLITTEWISYEIQSGRYTTLSSIIPFTRTSGTNGTETYTIQQHPITEGVDNTFTVSTSTSIGTANAGQTVVTGSVAGAAVVAAEYDQGKVVSFASCGKYSSYDAFSNENMQKLILNAVDWVGGSSQQWLSVDHDAGTVAPGSTFDLQTVFRSAGLTEGNYSGDVNILHDAPGTPSPVAVPCILYVDGVRRLSVTPSSLDFGSVWTEDTDTLYLNLKNSGSETTQLYSIISDNTVFTISSTPPLTVPAFDSVTIPVIFYPMTADNYTGTLTISSNAEDNPSLTVSLLGTGILGPQIAVSQTAFHEFLESGDSLQTSMSIINNGGDFLRVSLTNSAVITQQKTTSPVIIDSTLIAHLSAIQTTFSNTKTLDVCANKVKDNLVTTSRSSPALAKSVLIIQDTYPWGYNVIEPLLIDLGATVTTISSSEIASQNFTSFDVIVIPSVQTSSFYAAYRTNLAKFETYVQTGGVLEFHCATQGDTLTLPAGMKVNYQTSPTNYVQNRNHAITENVDTILTGSSASHTSFSSVPSNATILINNDSTQPTLVTYRFGSGTVVATGMTWEFYYPSGLGDPLMPNALNYCLNGTGTPWLSVNPATVTVAPYASTTIEMIFRTGDLPGGEYYADLALDHNAPGSSTPLVIPCSLTVDGFRRLSASPSSVIFGSLWVGMSDTMEITLTNAGNEATQVNTISSDNDAYHIIGSLPLMVPPLDEVVVQVVFEPEAAGSYNGELTIISNAEDNPSISVSLSGSAITGPSIEASPQQVSVSLAPDESTQRNVSLINSGGADLLWSINQSTGGIVSRETHDTIPGIQSRTYTANHDLSCTSWSDAGNDAFDGFGYPTVSVAGSSSSICMLEGDSSYTINGYGIQVRNDFAENHIYRSIIEPQEGESTERSDITINFNGNMGSDGSETVYLDSIQIAGNWLRFYVNEVSFPNSDPRVVFLIVPSKIEHRDNVTYWQPSSGYAAMEAANISLPATVYIIPSYHTLDAIKEWLENDLELNSAWLSVTPSSGTIPGGQILNVLFSFDATDMQEGTYLDTIKVTHNSPSQISPLFIPVILQVDESGPQDFQGGILSLGTTSAPVITGTRFRIVDLNIGSPIAGQVQGNRFTAILK